MSASIPTRILVIEASDGESGIEMARRERPDLIICDVHSSKLDGCAVIHEIKSNEALRHIPAVAVTLATAAGELGRIRAAGFDGCVSRAITSDVLVEQIEEFFPPERRSKISRPGE